MQLRMLAAGAMVSAVMGLAEAGVRSSADEMVSPLYGPSASLAIEVPRAITPPTTERAIGTDTRSSSTWVQRVLGA